MHFKSQKLAISTCECFRQVYMTISKPGVKPEQ